jgi:hypothetical protein
MSTYKDQNEASCVYGNQKFASGADAMAAWLQCYS